MEQTALLGGAPDVVVCQKGPYCLKHTKSTQAHVEVRLMERDADELRSTSCASFVGLQEESPHHLRRHSPFGAFLFHDLLPTLPFLSLSLLYLF